MTPSSRGRDKDVEGVEPDNAVVAQEVIKRTTPGPLRKESDLPRQALEVVLPPFIRHPSCLDGSAAERKPARGVPSRDLPRHHCSLTSIALMGRHSPFRDGYLVRTGYVDPLRRCSPTYNDVSGDPTRDPPTHHRTLTSTACMS